MRIGTDIDGVLADFLPSFLDRVGRSGRLPSKYDMTDVMASEKRDRGFEDIQEDTEFWRDLKVLEGTTKVADVFENHDLEFYTSRKACEGHMRNVMRNWLRDKFSVEFAQVYITPHKAAWMPGGSKRPSEKPLDAYIDDRPEVLAEVSAEFPTTRLFLRDQPYNRQVNQSLSLRYERVRTFDDFAKVFPDDNITLDGDAWGMYSSDDTPPVARDVRFETFVAAVRATMEGKAEKKSYNSTGIDGENPLDAFVGQFFSNHILGEIVYKCVRFQAKGNLEDMEKVAAWAFLQWRRGHR